MVLISSGFTKAVDPVGGGIKIGEYYAAIIGRPFSPEGMLSAASILESTAEFLLGACLLIGIHRKLTSTLTLLLLSLMTILTLYIAVTDAVSDCGCFGDALRLNNTATFLKNLILLAISITALATCRYAKPMLKKGAWIAVAYALVFILCVSLYSYHYLPIVDYRPYYIGQNIPQAMSIPANAKGPEFRTVYTLEKNGVRKNFSLENYPDSTWKFVDSETTKISDGYEPEISNFALYDSAGDEHTYDLIHDGKYSFWLILPRKENGDDAAIDAIEDVYDYAKEHGYRFLGITALDSAEIAGWQHMAGISIPFYYADETVLRTMVRSNPGLMLVKKGKILNKWSSNDMPDETLLTSSLEKLPLSCGKVNHGIAQTLKCLAAFFIPLIIIIFALRNRGKKTGRFASRPLFAALKENCKSKN